MLLVTQHELGFVDGSIVLRDPGFSPGTHATPGGGGGAERKSEREGERHRQIKRVR